MNPIVAYLGDSLGIALPLLVAAMGGLYTEASGALNIALEGLMVAGAFSFASAASATGSAQLGLAVSVAMSAGLALLIILVADRLSADVFVAGLAVNLLVQGVIGIVSEHVFGTKGVVPLPELLSAKVDLGFLTRLPFLGTILFRQRGILYILGGAVAALAVGFSRTPFGLRVRAAGMLEGSLRISGVNPSAVRYGAFAVSGAACALAGVALTRSVGAWVPNVSAGRGWVALVVIYLGGKRPGGIALASVGFGLLFALSNAAQAFFAAPSELVLTLPYAATAFLVLLGGARIQGRGSGDSGTRRPGKKRSIETPDGRAG